MAPALTLMQADGALHWQMASLVESMLTEQDSTDCTEQVSSFSSHAPRHISPMDAQ
jgi:hypothetical protein